MIASAVVTFYLRFDRGAWKLLLVTGAGTGGVLLLRWYWWRINAWSEVSAMTSALAMSLGLRFTTFHPSGSAVDTAMRALLVTGVTTVVWLVATFATKPEPQEILLKFYRSVRPQITGWKPIAAIASEVPQSRDLGQNLLSWVLGCIMVYMALFGLGHVLLGPFWEGIGLLTASAICAGALYSNILRSNWSD